MYADKMTDSMKKAINITHARREKQIEFNKKNGITPKTIIKDIPEKQVDIKDYKHVAKSDLPKVIVDLKKQMKKEAESLNFERAIEIRNTIEILQKKT